MVLLTSNLHILRQIGLFGGCRGGNRPPPGLPYPLTCGNIGATVPPMPRRPSTPPATDAKKAVAYLRKSTDVDGRQTNSIEVQRHDIEKWAKANGIEVVGWFTEHISGATAVDDSPELLHAIDVAIQQRVGIFVAAKRDRIAREMGRIATIGASLQRSNIRLVSADDANWQVEDPAIALMRTMVDAFASYELAQIRQRTKKTHEKLAREGRRQSRVAPIGFKLTEDNRLVPCEQEIKAMRLIQASRTGKKKLSYKEIAAKLNAQGIPPRATATGMLNRTSTTTPRWSLSAVCRWWHEIEASVMPKDARSARLAEVLRSYPR